MFAFVCFVLSVLLPIADALELFDAQTVSNADVYLNAAAGVDAVGCGLQSSPCKTLSYFLNDTGSNYYDTNFMFAKGNYSQPILSVNALAASQAITFTGQDDGVNIDYNATGSTYGFVISGESSVQYTRLTYFLEYYGTGSVSRTLIRTNGGTCYASNCTFTTTGIIKGAILRIAYGGVINVSRCVFKNIAWPGGNSDHACIFMGGNITGFCFVNNCTFTNLSSVSANPCIATPSTGVGNVTIVGGFISDVTIPSNSTLIQFSILKPYPRYTIIQSVVFANITQSADADINGFIICVTDSNYFSNSSVNIEGNTFFNISSHCFGGVIYSNASKLINIVHNTFTNCRTDANSGGAIYFDEGSNFEIQDCKFNQCGTDSGKGGAVFINMNFNPGSVHSFTQCRFSMNRGIAGKDIYHNATVSNVAEQWGVTFFNSTCTDCSISCFVDVSGNSMSVFSEKCKGEVYITGNSADDTSGCAERYQCGTIQYLLSLPGDNYPFIGVGNVNVTVSNLQFLARSESIIGDSNSESGLIGAYSGSNVYAVSVGSGANLVISVLMLIHSAGGQFLLGNQNCEVSIIDCVVISGGNVDLTGSFIHLLANSRSRILGTTFSTMTFSISNNAILCEGGRLTISSSTFNNVTARGDGSCVYANVTNADVVVIDDSTVFSNCSSRSGGALFFNLSVGTPFVLLSSLFYDNTAESNGAAIYIAVSNAEEVGNLVFNNDVYFYNNKLRNGSLNNVYLLTPFTQFPCFSGVYSLRNYDFFDFSLWTLSQIGEATVSGLSSILESCEGRCQKIDVVSCSSVSSCYFDGTSCVDNPCVGRFSGGNFPPCDGVCVQNLISGQCVIDGCQQFNVSSCADHSDSGCGVVLGKCIKASVTANPGLNNAIKMSIEMVPMYGKIFLKGGAYNESEIVIGAKELWIGSNVSLDPTPVVKETSTNSSMFSVHPGGGLDLNFLTLTSDVFNVGNGASLVTITEGRLSMNCVLIQNRRGSYCAVYVNRPLETYLRNCIFLNITHNADKGGAGLGINMLGKNFYTLLENVTFSSVWIEGTSQNTRFGGALWLWAHGSGLIADVISCKFYNATTTDSAGAAELYSDDSGGSIYCENTNFTDCFTTKAGGAASCRGKPVLFRNCTFTRCKAGTRGGAIDNGGKTDNYIEQCLFLNCSARNISDTYGGGAIQISSSGTCVISDCQFIGCFIHAAPNTNSNTSINALSVVVTGFSNCTISNCVFADSYFESTYVGRGDSGGLYVGGAVGSPLLIQGCTFRNNSGKSGSNVRAGGLYVYSSSLIMKNCTIADNNGDFCGGAYLRNVDVVFFGNVVFFNNTIATGSEQRPARDIYSTVELAESNFQYLCFENSFSSSRNLFVSIPTGNVSWNSECTIPVDNEPKRVGSPEDFLRAINQNVQERVAVKVDTSIDLPSVAVLTNNISITSGNVENPVSLTINQDKSNVFIVSTGSLAIEKVNVIVKDLGEEKAMIRLIGNGSVILNSIKFSYSTTSRMSIRYSNKGADGINTDLIFLEFGTVNISGCTFTDFVFGEIGSIVRFKPSSRGAANLIISQSNFSGIRTSVASSAESFVNPRFGLILYASLAAVSSNVFLSNVSISQSSGSVAVIVPTLANLKFSWMLEGVKFDVKENSHVYIGTETDELEDWANNNICDESMVNSLTKGGIGADNLQLCMGLASGCTAQQVKTINAFKKEICHEGVKDDDGNGGDGSEKKSSNATAVTVAIIVVVAVVVVVIIVAITVVLLVRIRTKGYKKYEEENNGKMHNAGASVEPTKGTNSKWEAKESSTPKPHEADEDVEEEVEAE